MLARVQQVVNFLGDPTLLFIGVFRVDGVPIVVRCKDKIKLLEIVDWLDKHVKNSLEKIVTEELNDMTTRFKDLFVRLTPISKTLALVIVSNDEMSLYKFEMDISSLRSLFS